MRGNSFKRMRALLCLGLLWAAHEGFLHSAAADSLSQKAKQKPKTKKAAVKQERKKPEVKKTVSKKKAIVAQKSVECQEDQSFVKPQTNTLIVLSQDLKAKRQPIFRPSEPSLYSLKAGTRAVVREVRQIENSGVGIALDVIDGDHAQSDDQNSVWVFQKKCSLALRSLAPDEAQEELNRLQALLSQGLKIPCNCQIDEIDHRRPKSASNTESGDIERIKPQEARDGFRRAFAGLYQSCEVLDIPAIHSDPGRESIFISKDKERVTVDNEGYERNQYLRAIKDIQGLFTKNPVYAFLSKRGKEGKYPAPGCFSALELPVIYGYGAKAPTTKCDLNVDPQDHQDFEPVVPMDSVDVVAKTDSIQSANVSSESALTKKPMTCLDMGRDLTHGTEIQCNASGLFCNGPEADSADQLVAKNHFHHTRAIDCSGFVTLGLAAAGCRLAPGKPALEGTWVGTADLERYILNEDGCFSAPLQPPVRKGGVRDFSLQLKAGDIINFSDPPKIGHVFAIDEPMSKDPFGLGHAKSLEQCESLSAEDFDFGIIQSAPEGAGTGPHRIRASEYLGNGGPRRMRFFFEKKQELLCKLKFRKQLRKGREADLLEDLALLDQGKIHVEQVIKVPVEVKRRPKNGKKFRKGEPRTKVVMKSKKILVTQNFDVVQGRPNCSESDPERKNPRCIQDPVATTSDRCINKCFINPPYAK